MAEEVIIRTNLSRSILLSIVFISCISITYLIAPTIGFFMLLLLAVGIFLQFMLTKKISQIIVHKQNQEMIFEYIQLSKKTLTVNVTSMKVREKNEVHFRGGKNTIFEIYTNGGNKKMFEISKRAFKTDEDYQRFARLFLCQGTMGKEK